VFDTIRKAFGGKIRIMLNGGAPIPREVSEFFHVVVTHEFYDGYGMTETVGAGIRSHSCDPIELIGTLTPFYNTEMKILSVPEMGYLATDEPPRGELLIRGPQVCCEYYKDPEATKLAFDEEGFVHTGDIVTLVKPCYVKIIDRRKNMFKLAQGEYVSGETIEGIISQSPSVESVFVHGESTQPYPVAIVVPNKQFALNWAEENKVSVEGSNDDEKFLALCKSKELKEFILSEITRLSKSNGLKGYEFVHNIFLHEIPFDEARNLISPSLKLKRHILKNYFAKELALLQNQ